MTLQASDMTETSNMTLNLTVDQALRTTRAVRKRLDLDRPVPREVIEDCVDLAVQAPSGSNIQRWHWVFVDEADKRRALAQIYRDCFLRVYGPDVVPDMTDDQRRMWMSARYLADHLHEVPVLLVACQWGRVDNQPSAGQAGYWGSILPAVWGFMLALRSRGLGSAWTTLHLHNEEQVANLLGIPYERCAQAGLFPVAYTKGTDFKTGPRRPLDEIIHWNNW
jgi:nitroreductase